MEHLRIIYLEVEEVIVVLRAVQILEGKGLALKHADSERKGGLTAVLGCVAALCKVSVILSQGYEGILAAGAEFKVSALDIECCLEVLISGYGNINCRGAEDFFADKYGAGHDCASGMDSVDLAAAIIAFNGYNGLI